MTDDILEYELTPEQKLLIAILVRSVQDAYFPKFNEVFTQSNDAKDAKAWFSSPSNEPFSFNWIKSVLNINEKSNYKIISTILKNQIEINGMKAVNFNIEKIPDCCKIQGKEFSYKNFYFKEDKNGKLKK